MTGLTTAHSVVEPGRAAKWIAGVLVVVYALVSMIPLLWILVTSVYLLRRTWRKPAPAAPSRPQAAKAAASA